MNTYRLIISTPDGTIFDDNVEKIMLRGANGDLAVLAGHMPFMTSVKKGECKVTFNDSDERIADINGNGKLDARDYLLLKRAYFGTYTIK